MGLLSPRWTQTSVRTRSRETFSDSRRLQDLDARIRTPDSEEGVLFPRDATFLRNVQLLNLITRFGDLDLSFRPAGTEGFPDLSSHAVEMGIRGLKVPVAALEDVIPSKEAAGRRTGEAYRCSVSFWRRSASDSTECVFDGPAVPCLRPVLRRLAKCNLARLIPRYPYP